MAVFDSQGELKQEAIEALYEIGSEGVGTAIVPIGNIREMEIRIETPNVIAEKSKLFTEIDYNPEQIVIGVTTNLNNVLKGSILFLLSKEFVSNTVWKITEETYTDEELLVNEDSISAIREIINYMTAGYAKVIGTYLHMPVYISSPSVGINRAQNMVEEAVVHIDNKVDKVVCVNTKFTIVDDSGKKTDEVGRVLIFPDEECIEKFIDIMGE